VSRLVLDENLSPRLVEAFRAAGHDAVHVNQLGLDNTPDEAIMTWARAEQRTVVTNDRDYHALLRADGLAGPSVIHLSQRGPDGLVGTEAQRRRLLEVLPNLEADLRRGAAVVVDRVGTRTTPLPWHNRVRPERSPEPAPARPAPADDRQRGGGPDSPERVRQRQHHRTGLGRDR